MIPEPTTQQQATTNAINALEKAEDAIRQTHNRFLYQWQKDELVRHAEVWSAIGKGWAAVANVLSSVDYQVKDDGSPDE